MHLHWLPNSEADFANYRIYRAAAPGFPLTPANRIAVKPDTGFVDPTGTAYCYAVTATDVHGNESVAATFPNGTTGVDDRADVSFALAAPAPNPARASALIRYTLPRAAPARLELFDLTGRRVRVFAEGPAEAGPHAGTFALEDAAGRPLAAGLYLVRLESSGLALTRRIAVVR